MEYTDALGLRCFNFKTFKTYPTSVYSTTSSNNDECASVTDDKKIHWRPVSFFTQIYLIWKIESLTNNKQFNYVLLDWSTVKLTNDADFTPMQRQRTPKRIPAT